MRKEREERIGNREKGKRGIGKRGARGVKGEKGVGEAHGCTYRCIDKSKSLILALSEHCWWV